MNGLSMQSGYKTVTPTEFGNVLWAYDRGEITLRDLRVYFACLAAVAVREAARRTAAKRLRTPKTISRCRINELSRLAGLPAPQVGRSLRRLERAGVLTFSESEIVMTRSALPGSEDLIEALACRRSPKRPIPVPRALLRHLAQNGTASLVKTAVAYMVRGLTLSRTGVISGRGTVKVSWIASVMSLSERAVRYARRHLIALGWIGEDEGSRQLKLNRHGAYFSIELDWTAKTPAQSRGGDASDFAPPTPAKITDFAPPIEYKKTSNEDGNTQKLRVAEEAGVLKSGGGKEASLRSVKESDLRDFRCLELLYAQAVVAGWISACEASALNFVGAAVRAREVGNDPPRLFVAIIRRHLWAHITHAQEDYARRTLARFREKDPDRFRVERPAVRLAA